MKSRGRFLPLLRLGSDPIEEIVLHGEHPISLRAAGEEALQEIERLEDLLDGGKDRLGLMLMDEQLPRRVRARKVSGAF